MWEKLGFADFNEFKIDFHNNLLTMISWNSKSESSFVKLDSDFENTFHWHFTWNVFFPRFIWISLEFVLSLWKIHNTSEMWVNYYENRLQTRWNRQKPLFEIFPHLSNHVPLGRVRAVFSAFCARFSPFFRTRPNQPTTPREGARGFLRFLCAVFSVFPYTAKPAYYP